MRSAGRSHRGYQLDAAGINASANDLRGWAGSGRTLTSGEKPHALGYVHKNVGVYYCINARYKWGNLDVNDINYALAQMDSKCRRYEASWFGWDGSVEIVGKARVTDKICEG